MERGWDIYQIYCDEDYSGADRQRPDFNRMLKAAKERKFQIILCKSQSRFTRDMELVEKYIHGLFPIWGIRFIAVADNADTDVQGNKKARQINGLVNEWYLEDLSENIRMVFDMKRRNGQYIGGFPIYGYQKHPADKNKIVIDPEAAEVVRQIFRWSLEGHGKQEIAHMLNDMGILNPALYKMEHGWNCHNTVKKECPGWNKTTVWRILRNEMYTGVMVQGKTKKASYKSKLKLIMPREQWYRVEGTHEAIIDRATFDAVQHGLNLRSRTDGSGEVHVLSGLVKCMDCGATMSKSSSIRSNGKRISYLRCRLYAESGTEKRCTRHGIRLDALLALISERIRYYVQTYYNTKQLNLTPAQNAYRAALEQEWQAIHRQLDKRIFALKKLYLDKVSGVVTEGQFLELNRSFLEEKNRMEQRQKSVERELAMQKASEQCADLLSRAEELLGLETIPRELIILLIEKVEVGERDPQNGNQEIHITWKF